jgi:hypothetical protein
MAKSAKKIASKKVSVKKVATKKAVAKKVAVKKSPSKKVSSKKEDSTNKAEYICLWLHATLKNAKYDDIIVNVTAVFYKEENIPLAAYKDKMVRLWQETNGEKFQKYDEVNVELVKDFKSMAKKGIFLMTKTK